MVKVLSERTTKTVHMEKFFNELIETYQSKTPEGRRKKIDSADLEKRVKEKYERASDYRKEGGYQSFAGFVVQKIGEGILEEIKHSNSNHRIPPLKQTMWLNGKKKVEEVDMDSLAMEVSDILNLKYYKGNKKALTKQEALRIKQIHQFFKKEDSEVLKREERSLMLFTGVETDEIETEKYLSSRKGKAFLKRLGMDLKKLKCEAVLEPFIYRLPKGKTMDRIQSILIIEGWATYNTLFQHFQNGQRFLNIDPDLFVWGSGYKILSSFEYMEELFGAQKDFDIRYFGDLDPEGFNIYCQLKERYDNYNISLEARCYQFLLEYGKNYQQSISKDQKFITKNKNTVSSELELSIPGATRSIQLLWNKRLRIPQEAMNTERLKEVKWVK